jgi:hypothetical protein
MDRGPPTSAANRSKVVKEKVLSHHGGPPRRRTPEREAANVGRRRLFKAALFGGAGLGLAGGGVAAVLNSDPARRTSPPGTRAESHGTTPVSTAPVRRRIRALRTRRRRHPHAPPAHRMPCPPAVPRTCPARKCDSARDLPRCLSWDQSSEIMRRCASA